MKVLAVAYACEEGRGSEPGAGFAWVSALASFSELTVLTRNKNVAALAMSVPNVKISVCGHDLTRTRQVLQLLRLKKLYYVFWQISSFRRARRMHEELKFNYAHHLTFAMDSLPSLAILLPGTKRIWGPVGGAVSREVYSPRVLGLMGSIEAVWRKVVLGSARWVTRRCFAPSVDQVIAQNDDVARFFHGSRCVVEPNVALRPNVALSLPEHDDSIGGRRLTNWLYIGRLVGWKGVSLTIRALLEPGMQDASLTICGSGPDERRLRRMVERFGLRSRVTFIGHVDRSEVGMLMRNADLLVQPSLRDSAGWAVGEALCAGLPVIVTDIGGPAELVRRCGGGVVVPYSANLPAEIATAVRSGVRPAACDAWSAERLPFFLKTMYASLGGAHEA